MKGFLLLLACSLFSLSLFSQSFSKLSKPERRWVLAHVCKAKKAKKITRQVQLVVDSIKKSGVIGSDNNGGALDAFKHAFWMASLTQGIGGKKALKLGEAHEKGNYCQFKKHQLEDSALPDSLSSQMDLFNNRAGVEAVSNCRSLSTKTIQEKIMYALKSGELRMMKKDKAGNFLSCDSEPIDMEKWKGKWNIPKCLVPSALP
jgi:hypothetical protein